MTETLLLGHCPACAAWNFPANSWGCRACGAPGDSLRAEAAPVAPVLRNAVTLHAELAPGLPVPCIIGEVELAPGVVEEALIDVPSEAGLTLGCALRAVHDPSAALPWRFVPVEAAR
jgi:hypothetical protein